jgi:putative endonuclease
MNLRSLLALRLSPFAPRDLGVAGEKRAAWYYRLRGYRILGRNVRFRDGEIDLVVRRGNAVAFVEVKTRQQLDAGEPFEAVDAAKERQLARLADRYLAARPLPKCEIRFDVISLYWTGARFRLTCYRDAFRSEGDSRYPWKEKRAGFRTGPRWN